MDEIIKAPPLSRRRLLGALVATGAAAAVGPRISAAQPDAIITRPIPSTDEKLPAVGLGSWITFNVGYDDAARASCAEVMRNFFEAGGTSLTGVRLVAMIKKKLEKTLSIVTLFECPTIRSLAARLNATADPPQSASDAGPAKMRGQQRRNKAIGRRALNVTKRGHATSN